LNCPMKSGEAALLKAIRETDADHHHTVVLGGNHPAGMSIACGCIVEGPLQVVTEMCPACAEAIRREQGDE
jgi:hypothetical protein